MTSNEKDRVLKMVFFICTLCGPSDSVFVKVRHNKISHLSAVSLFRVSILRENMQHALHTPAELT